MADSARIEELRRRVQSDPASIAFAALAEEYRRAGRYAEAVATCEAGLQRHPAYLSARVTLGRALLEMGEYDHAADELQRVLRIAPENLSAIRALADIHERRKKQRSVQDAEGFHSSTEASPGRAPVRVASIEEGSHPLTKRGQAPPPIEPERSAPSPVRVESAPAPAAPGPVSGDSAPPARPGPVPVAVSRIETPPHPDLAALPALEAFLEAIVRVRSGSPPDRLAR